MIGIPIVEDGMTWFVMPGTDIGFVPSFFRVDDPRPAVEQINERYAHGGGWHKFDGFLFDFDAETGHCRLIYPSDEEDEDDEVLRPIAYSALRKEALIMFEGAWLLILQADGTWEVSRVD